jgi:hypothetical protein
LKTSWHSFRTIGILAETIAAKYFTNSALVALKTNGLSYDFQRGMYKKKNNIVGKTADQSDAPDDKDTRRNLH